MRPLVVIVVSVIAIFLVSANPPVYRYLQTLVDRHGLREVITNKKFLSPISQQLGIKRYPADIPVEILLNELMANPAHRAYVTIYMLFEKRKQELIDQGQYDDQMQSIFEHSDALSIVHIPAFMGVDDDYDLDTLNEIVGEVMENSEFDIHFLSDAQEALLDTLHEDFTSVIGVLTKHYLTNGSYLLRDNHLIATTLTDDERHDLQELGYIDHEVIPQRVADELIAEQLTPELLQATVNGVDLEVVVDLMTEPGIFGDYVLDLIHISRLSRGPTPLSYLLGRELLLDVNADDFEQQLTEYLKVVNDPINPASLFQLVQLTRLEFPLAEIKQLSYQARDAIIVANPVNRDDFIDKFGIDTLNDVNYLVDNTGPLVLQLMGLGMPLELIKPHNLLFK